MILFFFENLRLPMLVDVDHVKFNKLLETFSLSYIASFIFFLIVVRFQEVNNQRKIFALLEEPLRSFVDTTCSVYKHCSPLEKANAIEVEIFFRETMPTSLGDVTNYYAISAGTNITNGKITQISLISWLKKINDIFITESGELVKHYGIFLDVDTITLFEELKFTDYTRLINSANTVQINNLSSLDIPEKYRVHHEIIGKIIKQVFSNKRVFIGFRGDRYMMIKKPYINKLERCFKKTTMKC